MESVLPAIRVFLLASETKRRHYLSAGTKAQASDLTSDMLAPSGYHGYFHYAEKGYSGVLFIAAYPESILAG